jgi:hypothetical protein
LVLRIRHPRSLRLPEVTWAFVRSTKLRKPCWQMTRHGTDLRHPGMPFPPSAFSVTRIVAMSTDHLSCAEPAQSRGKAPSPALHAHVKPSNITAVFKTEHLNRPYYPLRSPIFPRFFRGFSALSRPRSAVCVCERGYVSHHSSSLIQEGAPEHSSAMFRNHAPLCLSSARHGAGVSTPGW